MAPFYFKLLLFSGVIINFTLLSVDAFYHLSPTRIKHGTRLKYGGNDVNNDLQHLAALTTTEQWLTKAVPDNMIRKEVSYVVENGSSPSQVVSGIWDRLSQSREQGDAYAEKARKAATESAEGGKPAPYRSTLVIVCPGCKEMEDFHLFDDVVQTINESRRHARRFIIEDVADKMREAVSSELPDSAADVSWSTSVNLAHLHPGFEDRTIAPMTKEDFEELSQDEQEEFRAKAAAEEAARSRMTDEERALKDENDAKINQYKERKMKARRSPHPTLVIEVRTAVQDWGADATGMLATPEQRKQMEQLKQAKGEPNVDHLKNLEASFMKSAAAQKITDAQKTDPDITSPPPATLSSPDESEIARTTLNPSLKVEQWFNKKGADGQVKIKEFVGKNVDEAYGYLFGCLSKELAEVSAENRQEPTSLVFAMPRFLKSSATSFTKFAEDVEKMIDTLQTPFDIKVDYFHSEVVDDEKRAPTGVIVLTLRQQ